MMQHGPATVPNPQKMLKMQQPKKKMTGKDSNESTFDKGHFVAIQLEL